MEGIEPLDKEMRLSDSLSSIFDLCDEETVGKVSVSKLFTFISHQYLKNDLESIPSGNKLADVRKSLDPQNEGCEVDKKRWLAAWEPHIQPASALNINNNEYSIYELPREAEWRESHDSEHFTSVLDLSKQSFTFSPSSQSSSPKTDEVELIHLKAQCHRLLKLEKDLKEQLEISEDTLCQEITAKKDLLKDLEDKSSKIERLQLHMKNLEDSNAELKSMQALNEQEKIELCNAVSIKEDQIKRAYAEIASLQAECNLQFEKLNHAIRKNQTLRKEHEKCFEDLQRYQELLQNKDKEVEELSAQNENLLLYVDSLKMEFKMNHQLQNASFDNCEDGQALPNSLFIEGVYSSHNLKENTDHCSLEPNPSSEGLDSQTDNLQQTLNEEKTKCLYEELSIVESTDHCSLEPNSPSEGPNPQTDILQQTLNVEKTKCCNEELSIVNFSSVESQIDAVMHGEFEPQEHLGDLSTRKNEWFNEMEDDICLTRRSSCHSMARSHNHWEVDKSEKSGEQTQQQYIENQEMSVSSMEMVYQEINSHDDSVVLYTTPTNYTNYSFGTDWLYYLGFAFTFLLLLAFLTILCTAASLQIATQSGILSFPFFGHAPHWVCSILRPFINISKFNASLSPI